MVTAWCAWMLISTASASPEVRLEADASRIAAGQLVTVELTLRGVATQGPPNLAAQPGGLDVQYTGQNQTMSLVNGAFDRFTQHHWQVGGTRPGTYTLGPVEINTPNGVVRSGTLTLEITAATPGPNATGTTVDVTFSTPTAWQGQLVVLHTALKTREPVVSASWSGLPQAHLTPIPDAEVDRAAYTLSDPGGDVVVDEAWTALRVDDAGPLRWDAPAIQLDVAVQRRQRGPFPPMFREAERRVAVGEPLALDVQPLPPAPPGFSGLVGDFAVSARADRSTVAAGGSVSWSFEIVGSGDPTPGASPLPTILEGAALYPGAPQPRHRFDDGSWTAWNTWTTTVVPLVPGTLTLPPVQVVVFSPSKGIYETLTSEPIALDVTQGDEDALQVQAFGEAGDAPASDSGLDLRPRRGDAERTPWTAWFAGLIPAAGAPAVVAACWALLTHLRRWRRRHNGGPPTLAARWASLPTEPEVRWQALRALLVEAGPTAAPLLDRLDRLRFGHAGDTSDLEAEIRAHIDQHEGGR